MQAARRRLAAVLRCPTALKSTTSCVYRLSSRSVVDDISQSTTLSSLAEFRNRRWISNVVLRQAVSGAGRRIGVQQGSHQGAQVLSVRLVSTASSRPAGEENKKWRVSAILLFLPCLATFGLGTWQLFRRQWKIEVIEYRRKRLEEEPIPIVNAVAGALEISEAGDANVLLNKTEIKELEFRKVICEGVYDSSKNLYVGPRARSAFGVTQKGYYVITPLSTPDGSKSVQVPVLVNRGWVPSGWLDEPLIESAGPSETSLPNDEKVERVLWWNFWTGKKQSSDKEVLALPRARATVKVCGVIRGSEEPNMFVPPNVPSEGQWFYVDVPAMAHTLGLPDNTILIEAVHEPQGAEYNMKETLPIAKDPEALLHASVMPQDHINYALTWYSLSAATTFMAVKRVRASRRI